MKKLLMKWFPSYFTVIKYVDAKEAVANELLYIQKINDENPESFIEELGMTEERADELDKLVRKSIIDAKTNTDVMVKCSKYCRHVNEVFFCTVLTEKRIRQMSNPLAMIFNHLGKS